MRTPSEYRQYAEECRALAKQMQGDQRERLLDMASTWERLARDRSETGFPLPESNPVDLGAADRDVPTSARQERGGQQPSS